MIYVCIYTHVCVYVYTHTHVFLAIIYPSLQETRDHSDSVVQDNDKSGEFHTLKLKFY